MARQWPLPRGTFTITSRFAGRTNPVTGRPENHSGTDFAAPDGTPFYACAGGTVTHIGPASGYGQWIVIDHPDSEGGGATEYGHMWNAFATGLRVGSTVTAGQKIGYIGSNGQSTGPHLHLTVWRYARGGERVDPETWLYGRPYPPVGGGSVTGGKPAAGLTAATLARAMGGSISTSRASELLPGFIGAMRAAQITTPLRAAHWCAQLGHESVGLIYMSEIWGPSAQQLKYDPASGSQLARDLGNTAVGDGFRYRGSGPIQLTGKHNFSKFSQWCFAKRFTTNPQLFVGNPDLVRTNPRWGFLAASWYWTVARPQINSYADADDLVAVTRAINGGTTGIDDRRRRLALCKSLGSALLPPTESELDMSASEELTKRFPSRSKYRHSDAQIDTLAGFVLNIDGRIHEDFVERNALMGDPACIDLVKREAARGDAAAKQILRRIEALG